MPNVHSIIPSISWGPRWNRRGEKKDPAKHCHDVSVTVSVTSSSAVKGRDLRKEGLGFGWQFEKVHSPPRQKASCETPVWKLSRMRNSEQTGNDVGPGYRMSNLAPGHPLPLMRLHLLKDFTVVQLSSTSCGPTVWACSPAQDIAFKPQSAMKGAANSFTSPHKQPQTQSSESRRNPLL